MHHKPAQSYLLLFPPSFCTRRHPCPEISGPLYPEFKTDLSACRRHSDSCVCGAIFKVQETAITLFEIAAIAFILFLIFSVTGSVGTKGGKTTAFWPSGYATPYSWPLWTNRPAWMPPEIHFMVNRIMTILPTRRSPKYGNTGVVSPGRMCARTINSLWSGTFCLPPGSGIRETGIRAKLGGTRGITRSCPLPEKYFFYGIDRRGAPCSVPYLSCRRRISSRMFNVSGNRMSVIRRRVQRHAQSLRAQQTVPPLIAFKISIDF